MTAQDAQTTPVSIVRKRTIASGAGRAQAVVVLVLLAAAVTEPFIAPLNVTNDLGQALCLGLFAISFNLIFRYSGLLSFGHAAFLGFAAYATAKTFLAYPGMALPMLLATVGGLTAIGGLLVGQVCVRRAGAYFSMSTLAIAAFAYSVAFRWSAVTGGTDGLGGFMPQRLLLLPGLEIDATNIPSVYFAILGVSALVIASLWTVMELTPFGNAIRAVKQNEERSTFLGYNTYALKLTNFVIGAFVAGIAGSLWAIDNAFVSTDSIDLKLSVTVVILTFLGGSGWFLGPVLGSFAYIATSDWLSSQTAYWQIWLGTLFIAVVLVFPTGLSGAATLIYWHLARGRSSP